MFMKKLEKLSKFKNYGEFKMNKGSMTTLIGGKYDSYSSYGAHAGQSDCYGPSTYPVVAGIQYMDTTYLWEDGSSTTGNYIKSL